ncbi:hypothetical protein QBC47DRAFT_391641 [Echria macrotheca]|uniref:Uncharacterized protein n=1 Tax=Echria macrotheca TaxID=438768 RepID=A0AAJ0B500_9PEZI|nr:hypothetical protein QBC47DRAFT_391641 [Echria macrotheca]
MADGYNGRSDNYRIAEIKTMHKAPYPGIDPRRPELSQTGRTVLIAGGSTGIGFAIARGFVQAGALRVIILGRRADVVQAAAASLQAEAEAETAGMERGNAVTVVMGIPCDIGSLADAARLWDGLKRDEIVVDVLVLSAAVTGQMGPILQNTVEATWTAVEFNVRAILAFTDRFYKQGGENRAKKQYLVNVSSSAIHYFQSDGTLIPAYGLTKNAGTLLLQQIAKDTDVNDMQIVSFHPGGVRTEMAIASGVPENAIAWDDVRLPGQFAVWAASDEASFAHGKVLAAHWDVDELKGGEVQKKIEEQPSYLQIGVCGAIGI